MRWWDEFRNPKLKCKRLGHVKQRRSFPAYVETTYGGIGRGVADRATVSRTVCKRCKTRLSKDHISDRSVINSLSMPSPMWDHMNKHGYVPTDY